MPLRNEDKIWVQNEIQESLRSLKPQGWRKFIRWLREWAIVGTIVTAFFTLISIAITLGIFAASGLRQNAEFRTRTEDKLQSIDSKFQIDDKKIAAIEDKLLALVASQEVRKNPAQISLQEAQDIITAAQKKLIQLPATAVRDIGKQLIQIELSNPESWSIAKRYLSFRSILNADFAPKIGPPVPLDLTPKWSSYRESVTIIPNPQHPETHPAFEMLYAGGYTEPERSARFESLGKPQPEASGLAFFVLNGLFDTILIDGKYIKNVIFQHANIAYNGGPIRLENVYFIDCTFNSLQDTPNGRLFGKSLLASASTTFRVDQTVALLETSTHPLSSPYGSEKYSNFLNVHYHSRVLDIIKNQ